MFRCLWDVHNKYKSELVVSSSVVDEGNDNGFFTETSHIDKPRPSRSFTAVLVYTANGRTTKLTSLLV